MKDKFWQSLLLMFLVLALGGACGRGNGNTSRGLPVSYSDLYNTDPPQINIRTDDFQVDPKTNTISVTATESTQDSPATRSILTGKIDPQTGTGVLKSNDPNFQAGITCLDLGPCHDYAVDFYKKNSAGKISHQQVYIDSKKHVAVSPNDLPVKRAEDGTLYSPTVIGVVPEDFSPKKSPKTPEPQSLPAIPKSETPKSPISPTKSNGGQPSGKSAPADQPQSQPQPEAPAPQPQGSTKISGSNIPEAIGRYDSGKLINAIILPREGAGFKRHANDGNDDDKTHFWGTRILINTFEWAAGELNKYFPNHPALVVSDIAKKSGGRFNFLINQRSHQNGLDMDIGYPTKTTDNSARMIHFIGSHHSTNPEVDQERFWSFLKILASQPQVIMIFVYSDVKTAMCNYARDRKDYSDDPKSLSFRALNLLKNDSAHNDHFHVRFDCPDTSPQCHPLTKANPDMGTGCKF